MNGHPEQNIPSGPAPEHTFPPFDQEGYKDLFNKLNDAASLFAMRDDGFPGRYLEVNDTLCRWLGYSRAELLGLTPLDISEKQADTVNRSIAAVFAEKGQHVIERTLVAKDGRKIPVEINFHRITYKGKPVVLSLSRDISERKAAETALRESEEKFSKAFHLSSLPMTMSALSDNSFLDVNEEFERVTGWRREEALGRSTHDLNMWIHPEDFTTLSKRLRHDLSVRNYELELRMKSGKTLTFLWSADIVVVGGQPTVMATVHDISDRKEAEQAQQKLEQQIQQVQKLESIGILAGGIAHDFNNLLTGLFGYIEIACLQNKAGKAEAVALSLSKSLEVFNRARALTNQLLTFSKGGNPIKRALALPSLLTNSVNFVLSGGNLSVRFDLPKDLWPCEADENQLGQVIDNIVINARQAMPTGGRLEVAAQNIAQTGAIPAPLPARNYVKISIRDYGCGITRENLPHVFDPFFTTKPDGSGLGLATAYSIIRKHGGIITVESEPGSGSCFHFYLPALAPGTAEIPAAGLCKHRGQGCVLVLDDEVFVRDVTMEFLETMGYTVDCAVSSSEAVQKFRTAAASAKPYRFCILDLTIPGGKGGRETLTELWVIDPLVKAIAVSGYSHDPVMTDPSAFGFKDKIRKPFSFEELGEVLERVVGSNEG